MPGKSRISLDTDEVLRLYQDERLTSRQIADRLGISFRTVLRRLHGAGATMRAPGPDRHQPLRDAQWLRCEYVDKKRTILDIAESIGASGGSVRQALIRHGIDTRPPGQNAGRKWSDEVRKRMSDAKAGKLTGPANPNWRGGLVHPDTRLRASYSAKAWSVAVRERDGNVCVKCGASGRLHAHHVKSWKDAPELRFDVSNGITLCPPCHQKEHGWRFPAWAYHGETRTSAKHSQE